MFLNRAALRTSFYGLVGFRQPTDPAYSTYVASLVASREGRFINDVHALLNPEIIDQAIKNFDQYSYPAFGVGTEYSLGEKVLEASVNYEYINATPSTGNTPPNATYWKVIDETSDFLIKAQYAGIDRMIDEYINAKKLRTKIRSIFDNVLLFNGVGNYRDLEPNANLFVGLRIRLKRGEQHLVTILNKLGHQFNGTLTGLTMYLYHSSSRAAIATWTINHTTASTGQWTAITLPNGTLRYLTDYDAGGDFYVGYNQSDIEAQSSVQAINKDVYWNNEPCGGCDSSWRSYYKQYSPFVEITSFSIAESLMPSNVLFDPSLLVYDDRKTFGLNLNLTTKCDLAVFFTQEENYFAEALSYHIALVLLEAIAFSTREANQLTDKTRKDAKRELYRLDGAWGSVSDRAKKAISAMSFDFSGMDKSCLPMDNKSVMDVEVGTFA